MTCAEWQAVYALATEWSRTPEPVTPESEWTALENATITAARHLLADGRETPGMRTERTMQLERTLSYLRWLLILASGADEGERRYDACRARAGQQCGGGQTV